MIIKSIAHLLNGRGLISVAPQETVKAACALLTAHDIGALAVVDNGKLVGVLSERDVIRRCISGDRKTAETQVAEVMTQAPVTVQRDASLADAQTKMFEGGFRHLPVVDEAGRAIGMLSMRDIPTEYRLMVERFREYRGVDAASL